VPHSNFDWQKGVTAGCTSARVIAALCDVIDRGVPLELTDQWPLPHHGALLEADQLDLPEPYIWDID
jgi:hypothetical protein